jgi:hypothetical protein
VQKILETNGRHSDTAGLGEDAGRSLCESRPGSVVNGELQLGEAMFPVTDLQRLARFSACSAVAAPEKNSTAANRELPNASDGMIFARREYTRCVSFST